MPGQAAATVVGHFQLQLLAMVHGMNVNIIVA